MTFVSCEFFLLLLISLIVYYCTPVNKRWIILLISSIIFYAFSGVSNFVFIISSALIAFISANMIEDKYKMQDDYIKNSLLDNNDKKNYIINTKKKTNRILLCAVAAMIFLLVYFKIANKLYESISIFKEGGDFSWFRIAVPLGISYYTFSLAGYVANVYWKKEKAEHNFLKLLLFAIYFPKILQGPIVNHKKIANQLTELHYFNFKDISYGLQLIIYGLFKKLVIADRLAIFVNNIFDINSYMEKSGLIFVIGALFASMQLYCDFSGCMDIAEGVSELFGIKMEKNFNHPFFARNAADFWRRWHITLGLWFKDYVYMPLVISPHVMKIAQCLKKKFGTRAMKSFMVIVPTAIVWLLTGLWHGTGYNYIAWGIYWGTIIIITNVFSSEIKRLNERLHINTQAGSWKILQMIRTYVLFSFGRIITLPGHLRTSFDIIRSIFKKFDIWILFDGSLYNYGLNQKNFSLVVFSCFVVWCVSMLQERGSVRERIAKSNIVIRWGIYYIALFTVIVFGVYGAGYNVVTFSYMNF